MPTGTTILYFVLHPTHAGPREATSRQKKKLAQKHFRDNISTKHRTTPQKNTKKGGNGHESGNVYDITDVDLTRLPHLLLPQKRHRKRRIPKTRPGNAAHHHNNGNKNGGRHISHISLWYLPPCQQSSQKLSSCSGIDPPFLSKHCIPRRNRTAHNDISPSFSLSLGGFIGWVGLGCLAQDGLPQRMPLPPSRRRTFCERS